jgi:HEXXH motif-containing protein
VSPTGLAGPAGPPKQHRLTREQFDALAAGYGDAETLGALARAQVTKRLLLLREVRLRTRLGADPAWSVLDAAMARRPEAARQVLSRPFVDEWACRLLRPGGAGTAADSAYLSGIAAAAAVAAEAPFELPPPAGPTLLLPGLGRLALPRRRGVLRFDGAVLTVAGTAVATRPAALRPGPDREPPSADDPWHAYRTIRWGGTAEPLDIEVDDLDDLRTCFGLPPADRLGGPAARRLGTLVSAALTLVHEQAPAYAPTVRRCLRSIVPLARPAEGSASASNQHTFGAVAVSPPADAAELALLLVHETQHAKLAALLDLVDLVDPSRAGTFHAPWRADPRPAGALLQGTYAHAAVADFWRLRRRHVTGAAARTAEFEYAYWRAQAGRAADTLARSDALTPRGRDFVDRLADAIASWRDDVPGEIRMTVSACTTVTDVEWRLRNHRTRPADLAAAVAAYRAGAACPVTPASDVVPVAERSAMSGSLVRKLRQRVIERTEAAPGDVMPSVADLDQRLAARPEDAAGWAMLAVALGEAGSDRAARTVAERPEAVRDVLAAVVAEADADSGRTPVATPSAVAEWLVDALAPADEVPA